MLREEDQDRQRIAELELQQAQDDASLAERRYAACNPDNRLIAAQLEKAWDATLQRLVAMPGPDADNAHPDLTGLADDLTAAWLESTANNDANTPAAGASPDHGDCRRRRQGRWRDRARHPPEGWPAFSRPRRMASGSPCATRPQRSVSATIRFAS